MIIKRLFLGCALFGFSLGCMAQTDSLSCAIPMKYTPHYYERCRQFDAESAIKPIDIIMLGNSLIENGGDWGATLGNPLIRNRGIIGDEVMGVYDRLNQILPGQPQKIFLLIGINDVSHHLTADSVAMLVCRVVEKIRIESPQTQLYLQSLLPINEELSIYKSLKDKTNTVVAVNDKLRQIALEKEIVYIDLFPDFVVPNTAVLAPHLTRDGLHINTEGYEIWCKRLKPYL